MTIKYMDVHTDEGIYKLILDDNQAINEEDVYELIKELNVPGTIWHGWTPYDDHNNDAAIIVFGVDANIKSVRIYEENSIDLRIDVPEGSLAMWGLLEDTIQTTFLNNPCTVKVVGRVTGNGDRCFILPYEVNGLPALDAMSENNLTQLIQDYACKNNWGSVYSNLDIIIPGEPLTRLRAGEYLRDDCNIDRETRKAKAWNGWKDNDDNEREAHV